MKTFEQRDDMRTCWEQHTKEDWGSDEEVEELDDYAALPKSFFEPKGPAPLTVKQTDFTAYAQPPMPGDGTWIIHEFLKNFIGDNGGRLLTGNIEGLGSTRALCARNFDFDLCTHSFTSYLATWSINILTFMTTIFFLTFNILSRSDKYVKSLQFLNNSGFRTITIPMDRISVFVIFLSPQGLIELPCINLFPCQRKIIVRFTITPT